MGNLPQNLYTTQWHYRLGHVQLPAEQH
uniref:Uncharacterized protein n=1 Tax=Anguilla anguilla TaxID=7936 RepID=A0A0E9T3Y4_ANGAN